MIYKLKGKVSVVDENTICVETNNGVAYEVVCTSSDVYALSNVEGEATVYTYLQVREDALVLFGFKSLVTKSMFSKLITISGIGPKMAITILSDISPEDLSNAIVNGDTKSLSSVKGLGKKTAERIILELKEKVQGTASEIKKSNKATNTLSSNEADSVIALCSLGLSKNQATDLVSRFAEKDMSTEEIVTICLKNMGR